MATIHLVSPMAEFGQWDYRNPDDPGIGGSETMHCEMAWRLAARGHQVLSYAPLREDTPSHYRGVAWRHVDDMDTSQPGLWVIIRDIHLASSLPGRRDQRVWAVFQDYDQRQWPRPIGAITRIIGLCAAHCTYLKRQHPACADRIVQSRNGLRGDLVDATLAGLLLPRQPHRLMFASSPDRGLRGLLRIFPLIRLLVPDAELHVCYGWDNIDHLTASKGIAWEKTRLLKLAQQPGVVLRGRMGQPQLYQEWAQAALMVSPTNFLETSYISLMEAQALGAIPIVNPIWAAGEHLISGYGIEGDGEQDETNLLRYAMTAVALMQHPEAQESLRSSMMSEARKRFDWETVVDQYETWMQEDGLV